MALSSTISIPLSLSLPIEKESRKLKIGFLNSISAEWVHLYKDSIEQVSRVDDADYIIYESNGDPVPVIMKILATFPRNKLVFILSGDQSVHINDECIWFTNAVRSRSNKYCSVTSVFSLKSPPQRTKPSFSEITRSWSDM